MKVETKITTNLEIEDKEIGFLVDIMRFYKHHGERAELQALAREIVDGLTRR